MGDCLLQAVQLLTVGIICLAVLEQLIVDMVEYFFPIKSVVKHGFFHLIQLDFKFSTVSVVEHCISYEVALEKKHRVID